MSTKPVPLKLVEPAVPGTVKIWLSDGWALTTPARAKSVRRRLTIARNLRMSLSFDQTALGQLSASTGHEQSASLSTEHQANLRPTQLDAL